MLVGAALFGWSVTVPAAEVYTANGADQSISIVDVGAAPTVTAVPVGVCTAGMLPALWLFWKRRQRLARFESQMPDAMDLLARSLRETGSTVFTLRISGRPKTDRRSTSAVYRAARSNHRLFVWK